MDTDFFCTAIWFWLHTGDLDDFGYEFLDTDFLYDLDTQIYFRRYGLVTSVVSFLKLLTMVSRCLVPGCKNKGRHALPKNPAQRSLWLKAIRLEGQELKMKSHFICTVHFKDSDYTNYEIDPVDCRKGYLARHAVPSIFPWNQAKQEKATTFINLDEISASGSVSSNEQDPLIGFESSTTSVTEKQSSSISSDIETDSDVPMIDASLVKNTYSKEYNPIQFVPELSYLEPQEASTNPLSPEEEHFNTEEYFEDIDIGAFVEIMENNSFECNIKEEDNNSFRDSTDICKSCGQSLIPSYSIHSLKKESGAVHFYTGLETYEKLIFVFYSLGDSVNKLNYFYGKPPEHLDALEQFCMTLLILRRHREFEDVAMTYKTSVKQVTNIFITWIRFMALQWCCIDLWLDREKVTYYMPLDFYDKYPKTRTIIDATECPIKKPLLPSVQQITFSSYKNRNTIKLLVGIAPSGMITYLSPCYGGSTTDRQIIERSAIINELQYNDEIMVDKGLNVQDIFVSRGVKVNMPTFFKKGNQISSSTLLRDRKIASKRVHVERLIGMLKTYKILTQAMNHTETLLSSDITFVIAMLVNFRSNIINKNA